MSPRLRPRPSSQDGAGAPVRSAAVVPSAALGALGALVAVSSLFVARWVGQPLLAPVLLLAAAAAPLLLVQPAAALVLAVVVEAANLPGVAADNGVPGVFMAVLATAAASAGLAFVRGRLRLGWSPVFLFALLLLAAQWTSALVSPLSITASAAVVETVRQLVWLGLLVSLLLTGSTTVLRAAAALVVTLALLSLLTGLQEFVIGNDTTFGGLSKVPLTADVGGATARHAGPQLDVNFWGRVLVLGLPFALTCMQVTRTTSARLAGSGAAAAIFGGVVLTGSRGGMIAAAVVICCWALLTGGPYAKALLGGPLVVGLALLTPGVGSRLATLSLLESESGLQAGDASLEGRVAAQRVALRVFQDHPAFGVGPGTFLEVAPDYLRALGLRSIPLAPHNQYLEVAAEGGLTGLGAWLLFFGSAVFVALRARVVLRRLRASRDVVVLLGLANATLAALVGWAVSSVFLHLATFRTLLIVVAVAVALDLHASRLARRSLGPGPEPPGVDSTGRARRAPVVGLALFAVLLNAYVLVESRRPATTWEAATGVELVVRTTGATPDAYELDAVGRANVVRTFAGLMAASRFAGAAGASASAVARADSSVRVANTNPSGLIVVTARGDSEEQARDLAADVRAAGVEYVDGLDLLYTVRALPAAPTSEPLGRGLLGQDGVLAAATLTSVSLVAWAVVQRRRRRRT